MAIENINTVNGELNYYVPNPDGSKPFFGDTLSAEQKKQRKFGSYQMEKRQMQIENVRGNEGMFHSLRSVCNLISFPSDKYTLDKTGFQLVNEPTTLKHEDFASEDKVTQDYYSEQVDMLKKVTGASRVVLFDHSMFPAFPLSLSNNSMTDITSSHSSPTPTDRRVRGDRPEPPARSNSPR